MSLCSRPCYLLLIFQPLTGEISLVILFLNGRLNLPRVYRAENIAAKLLLLALLSLAAMPNAASLVTPYVYISPTQCLCVCVCVCVCACVCVCVFASVCVHIQYIHVYINIYTYIYICYVYMYIYMHIYIYLHMCIHILIVFVSGIYCHVTTHEAAGWFGPWYQPSVFVWKKLWTRTNSLFLFKFK